MSDQSSKGGKDPREPRPEGDLEQAFLDAVRNLEILCDAYDAGEISIAVDIAQKLRVFGKHFSKGNRSLLDLMGLTDILYLSTADVLNEKETNVFGSRGLVSMSSDLRSPKFVPNCHIDGPMRRTPVEVPFNKWWTAPVFESAGYYFSREKLVSNVANLDGGSHVPEKIDEDYAAISKGTIKGWHMFNSETGEVSRTHVERAGIRQIAYELLMTLEEPYKELLKARDQSGRCRGGKSP